VVTTARAAERLGNSSAEAFGNPAAQRGQPRELVTRKAGSSRDNLVTGHQGGGTRDDVSTDGLPGGAIKGVARVPGDRETVLMTDQPPPRHSVRYYAIVGPLLLVAAVLGFVFIDEAGWASVLIGCFIGGFLIEGIADLVRRNRSKC
jgi:hypothetical protein